MKQRFSLPKSTLLTKSWEYNHVYRQGKRLRGNNFSLVYTPNNLTVSRCGISIHGRLKGSVKRNRIKRIIKEFYRLNREFMSGPTDMVFTVRQGFRIKNPTELKQAVNDLLKRSRETVIS